MQALSGSCQAVVQAIVRQSLGSCLAIIKLLSGSNQAIIRQSSNCFPIINCLFSLVSFVKKESPWRKLGKSLQFTTTQSGLGSVNCFCARPMNDLFFPLMRSRVPTTDITIWAERSFFGSKKLFVIVCLIWGGLGFLSILHTYMEVCAIILNTQSHRK